MCNIYGSWKGVCRKNMVFCTWKYSCDVKAVVNCCRRSYYQYIDLDGKHTSLK